MPARLTVSPVTERLGFTDFVRRLAGEAPRRDRDRLLFTDLRPELRASKIGAIRLPRADGSRLRLTEYFQFVLDLAIADSNLTHSLRNHYVAIENAILDPTPSSPRLLALAAGGLLFGGRPRSGPEAQAASRPTRRSSSWARTSTCSAAVATTPRAACTPTTSACRSRSAASSETVLVESGRPGVELPDDWDGFGQRLTGSGSIVLDRVRIMGADYVERPVIDEDRPSACTSRATRTGHRAATTAGGNHEAPHTRLFR